MRQRWLHFCSRVFRKSLSVLGGVAALAVHANGAVTPPPTNTSHPIDSDSLMVAGTALDIESMQSLNVLRRITALRSGARGLDVTDLNLQAGELRIGGDLLNAVSQPLLGPVFDGVLNRDELERWGAFASGDVRRNSAASIGGATADDSIGMTTGIDYRIHDRLVIGSSIGYASYGIDAAPQSIPLDVQSRRVSLFGTYFRPNLLHVDGLIAYGRNSYDATRRIDGAAATTTRGATNGNQVSAALTSALDLSHGAWRFAPNLGAYLRSVDVRSFDATGPDDSSSALGARSLRLSAGAQMSVALNTPMGLLTPNFNADYLRDDANGRALGALDPGYFVWSVGASAQVARALSGFVSYRSPLEADEASGELTMGIRLETSPY